MDDLNKFFKLPAHGDEQDWSVQLANSCRIREFIDHYHEPSFGSDHRKYLMDLIFASYDELLGDEDENCLASTEEKNEIWNKICALAKEEPVLHQERIDYWSCLDIAEDEPDDYIFLLTPRMRKLRLSLMNANA